MLSCLVAVHPTTGAVVQTFPGFIPNNSVPKVMVRDAENFYLGAEGTGGGVFDGRLAARLSDGVMLWRDTCLGATQATVEYQGTLYSASHAHDCSENGFPDGRRNYLMAQDATTSKLLGWDPRTNDGTPGRG